MYLPEKDPYSLNFQNAGYRTTLLLFNAASMIFNFGLHFSVILVLIFVYLMARCCACAARLHTRVQYYLFWNGSIRLFMEAYMEFALFALMNIHEE